MSMSSRHQEVHVNKISAHVAETTTRGPRWSAGIRRETSDRSPATRCGYASRRPVRRFSRSARPSSSVGPVD
jgi:hypothetical protein